MAITRNFWEVTAEEFIISFGLLNSIELSDLDDPESQTIRYKRINLLLDHAYNFIESYTQLVPPAAQIQIRQNFRRLQLDIARYYLDSDKSRPEVETRYEQSLEWLEKRKECPPRTPFDANLAKQFGLTPNRTFKVRMVSDQPIPILNRTSATDIYRRGDLFDTSGSYGADIESTVDSNVL